MESQKDIIDRLLKQQDKKKRDLAAYIGITENSINRMLRNKNISMGRLRKIAEFLELELSDILPKKIAAEPGGSFQLQPNTVIVSENIVEKLSEALLAGTRTNENQSKTIENLVKILKEKID